jgi:predicted RNA-binding Zn ribbon-like protein
VLIQDLANTLNREEADERLVQPADLTEFARSHGLPGLTFTRRDLERCRAFREAVRDACRAHTGATLGSPSSAVLERELSRARLVVVVDDLGEAALVPAAGLSGASALLAHLAAGIATATARGTWSRLKSCDSDSCRWVFYDHSPAGRGRWCSMQLCGSRAKVRSYRSRHETAVAGR